MFRFWDAVTWFFELFAFILVGALLSVLEINLQTVIFAVVLSIIIIIGRFIGIFLVTLPLELKDKTKEHFNTNERLFIAFAGIKGLTTAILALMAFITLDFDLQVAEIILDSTIIVLIVTGLFQGVFIKPFASKTSVLEEQDELEELLADRIVLSSKLEYLVNEFDNKNISAHQYRMLSIPLKERLVNIRERILMLRAERDQRHNMVQLLEKQNQYAQEALNDAKIKDEISDISFNTALTKLNKEQQNLSLRHQYVSDKKK